jgi:hypothetical protein
MSMKILFENRYAGSFELLSYKKQVKPVSKTRTRLSVTLDVHILSFLMLYATPKQLSSHTIFCVHGTFNFGTSWRRHVLYP